MPGRVRRYRRINHLNRMVFPHRVLRDRSNPLEEYTADEVFARYRFRPDTIMFILSQIINPLRAIHDVTKNNALPPLLQLLTCLRFLATGAFHMVVGDIHDISTSTAGRCCRNVSDIISRVMRHFITFPTDRRAREVKQNFMRIAGFPNVLGCVDGTFIKIMAPSENEPDYVNRKGFHSLNVQMVCDSNYVVTSVSAKWPGSVHDSRIWKESELNRKFENGQHSGFILGDSGYPCKRFLMTPFLNPTTQPQQRFNKALCKTRVLIEQTFGVIKRRFPCLHETLR